MRKTTPLSFSPNFNFPPELSAELSSGVAGDFRAAEGLGPIAEGLWLKVAECGESDPDVGQRWSAPHPSRDVANYVGHGRMVDAGNEVANVFIAAERGRGADVGLVGRPFAWRRPVVVVLAEIGSFLFIGVVPGTQAAVDGLGPQCEVSTRSSLFLEFAGAGSC